MRISLWERRWLSPSFCWIAKDQPWRRASGLGDPLVQAEGLAQVDAPDLFVGGKILRSARPENMAVPENIGPVRYFQGLAHVVVGDEDADAPVPQVRR